MSTQAQAPTNRASSDRPVSQTEELTRSIRKTPLFRQLVPMEAGTGWPIPLRRGDPVYAVVPFYGLSRSRETGQTALYPPLCTITVDWSNRVVVEYVNLRFRNPWPEGRWAEKAGTFPHDAVKGMTVAAYKQARLDLLLAYDELFGLLQRHEVIPEDLGERLSKGLRLLLEPPLEPYYRALAPAFFRAYLGSPEP